MKKSLLIVSALLSLNAFAQVPANDDCSGASLITVGSTCNTISAINANATLDLTTHSCQGDAGFGIWYKFVVPASGNVQFESYSGASITDGIASLYTGTCASLTEVKCDDDGMPSGSNSLMPKFYQSGLTPGSMVYLLISSYDSTDVTNTGAFTFCVKDSIPPAAATNTSCATATTLTVGATCNYISTNNIGAGSTLDSSNCPTTLKKFNNVVWYKFTVPASGNVKISTTAGSLTDGIMVLMTGNSCGALVEDTCSDDVNNSMPEIFKKGLTPGSVAYIKFGDYGTSLTEGTFNICIMDSILPIAVTNTSCSSATNLTVGATCNYISTSNIGAGSTLDASNCPNTLTPFNNIVWYKFTVPASGSVKISTTAGTITDGVMVLMTGADCGSLVADTCSDDEGAGSMPEIFKTGLMPGSVAYIKFGSYGTTLNEGTFNICISDSMPPAPAANTTCATANDLTVGTVLNYISVNNIGALNAVDSSLCPTTESKFNKSVWFKFTAPASGKAVISTTSGTLTDAVMVVYSGTCAALVADTCSDDEGAGLMPETVLSGLTPGSTVFIKIGGYGNNGSEGTFNIAVMDSSSTTVNINEELNNQVSIYPNPSNGNITLESAKNLNGNLTVYNVVGSVVYTEKMTNVIGTKSLNLTTLSKGMYTVRISTNAGIATKKIIIE